jgi:hypothetical protein
MFGAESIIPALLLQAGAVAAKYQGDKQVRRQQKQYAESETSRQNKLGNEAGQILGRTLPQFDRPAQDAKQASIANEYQAAVTPQTAGTYATKQGSPTEVRTEMARQVGRAIQAGKTQARASAQLHAPSELAFDNSITLGRSGQDLAGLNDFSRGSSGALGSEMQASVHKADNYNTAAQTAGGLGDIWASYAMTRKPPKRTVTRGGATNPEVWKE